MTNTRQLLAAATLVVAGLTGPSVIGAQTTVHTSLASFLASTQGPLYTETFPFVPSAPSFSFSSLGFGYTVTTGGGNVYRGSLLGTFIGNSTANRSLLFTFTTGNVTAVGGNFFLTGTTDNLLTGNISISLSDGTLASFTGSSVSDFRGFTTTGAVITSLTLAAPSGSLFNSADNIVVGLASASVVPEPSTYLLVGVGLTALLGVARRRNRVG